MKRFARPRAQLWIEYSNKRGYGEMNRQVSEVTARRHGPYVTAEVPWGSSASQQSDVSWALDILDDLARGLVSDKVRHESVIKHRKAREEAYAAKKAARQPFEITVKGSLKRTEMAVILLGVRDGMSFDEIAEMAKLNREDVRSRFNSRRARILERIYRAVGSWHRKLRHDYQRPKRPWSDEKRAEASRRAKERYWQSVA